MSDRDWATVVKALRVKAADSAVTLEEATALRAKADELESKYGPFDTGAFVFFLPGEPDYRLSWEEVLLRWRYGNFNKGWNREHNPPPDWLDEIVDDKYLYGDE